MLMTPMTPKVMASPMAASSSTEPSDSPYQAFCTALHSASLPWILALAAAPPVAPAAADPAAGSSSEAERVLVAAVADDRDGGDLVGGAGVGLRRG